MMSEGFSEGTSDVKLKWKEMRRHRSDNHSTERFFPAKAHKHLTAELHVMLSLIWPFSIYYKVE